MKIRFEQAEGTVKKNIPPEHETIADDFDLNTLFPIIRELVVYFRPPDQCPFRRGNWVLDITLENGQLFCVKLPKEMKEDHVKQWIKPLTDKLDAKAKEIKSKMN